MSLALEQADDRRHRHQQKNPGREEYGNPQRPEQHRHEVCNDLVPHLAHLPFPVRPYFLFISLVSLSSLRDSSSSEYVDGRLLPHMWVPATNPTTALTNRTEGSCFLVLIVCPYVM